MAERNGTGNRTLEQLVAWYAQAIRVAEADSRARRLWAYYGCYSDGSPIVPSHQCVYGMSASLQRAFPSPFAATSNQIRLAGQGSYAERVRARGAVEYPQLCGDTAGWPPRRRRTTTA